jgi:hypothetical protein
LNFRSAIAFGSVVFGCLFVAGCGSAILRSPVPQNLADKATVAGMPAGIRFWGDETPKNLDRISDKKMAQMRKRFAVLGRRKRPRQLNFLSISGGGSYGAFGAGLLNGWTARGTRPEFEVVTGVSTGALIAPFAFLGPEYDEQLKEIYTTISTKDVLRKAVIAGLTGGSAIADSRPLLAKISQYANKAMLAAIAREHAKGRRLFVGTTNSDAERPVIWDMGEIASSGHPDALGLFRKILLASASIPVAFPPVILKVRAGGRVFDEMHVDGGVTRQVFLYPSKLSLKSIDKKHRAKFKRKLYIIRNGKLTADWSATDAKLMSIAGRAVSTLIKNQGIGDIYQLYVISRRDRLDYNLAYMPAGLKDNSKEAFDKVFMNRLYKVGFKLGRNGYRWQKAPPSLNISGRN